VQHKETSEQVSRVRPDGHPMHVEPPTDRDHALTVRAGCSDSVHLALREGCSSSSPRVRDDSRLIVSGTVRLIAEHELRLILRGTQPLEPLPGVRFESTRVHNFGRTRTADIGRCGCWCEGGERLSELDRRPFVFADLDAVGERLVRQSLALIVGARVQGRAVYEQAECGAEVLA